MISTIDQLKAVLEAMDGSLFDWHERQYKTIKTQTNLVDVNHGKLGQRYFVVYASDLTALKALYQLLSNSLRGILWEDNTYGCHTIQIPIK